MFIWPAFESDSRANRLKAYEVGKPVDAATTARWVDLCGPEEVATQVALAYPSSVRVEVPPGRRSEWSHRFFFESGPPDSLTGMLDFLKKYLTLTATPRLDFAVAFDWYKKPEDGVEPNQWKNTTVGELVYRGKYYKLNPIAQRRALTQLATGTAKAIAIHPLYSSATTVITVPGHKNDGKSFGEKYAARVASELEKTLVVTECTIGERPPAKETGSADLDGKFHIRSTLAGPAIIIDDVYRSGGSFRATALAALHAGATHVYGLAAVRTLRN
ncbi:phosphoribosyltransferase [Micromonospora sp. NPDC051296]|uniref:phosphoribosyltransferase n=1 Tax=Micromonospora sp. NPDC051296 TaxID=3155046 RepID=UPI00342D4234